MKKSCKTCGNEFLIREEDLIFYEQVKTVLPQYCPDCRMMRRLAFRNERTLYKRTCDLCKNNIISIYTKDSPFKIYCHDCWWSDKWNPKDLCMDYDLSKSFFEQYKELQLKVPRLSLILINSTNSDYTNCAADNKNCYLIFASDADEDCMYGRLIQESKGSVDCAFLYSSELCYECIDTRQCFKCMFCEECQTSSDLLFCYNMRNSQNCILCTNGRNMSNSILNVKYSKEEYDKKKTEILESYESIENTKKEFEKIKSKIIYKYASQTKCHNITGDYIHNCYDGVRVFNASDAKNCSYMADTEQPIDCMDCNNSYYKPELCYNILGILNSSKSKNCAYIFYCNEIEYCENTYNLANGFGCIGIRKGEYMILNKQYTKDEYYILKNKIVESMKTEGLYGQYFPPYLAPFGFNETLGHDYYPVTKEWAKEKGFKWQEKTTGTYGEETIKENCIPDIIEKTPDSITSDILGCKDCKKNFKITQNELNFYRRMHLPIPHKDFECRHQDRIKKRNPRQLWPRSCMCKNEQHHNHTGRSCPEKFETTYSPDRPETIYCESCYQQEVA